MKIQIVGFIKKGLKMQGHIDKITKKIKFDINNKPIGASQWDFICLIPEAEESLINNYKKGPEALFVYLTSKCSKKCKKCSEKNKKDELEIELFRNIIEKEKNNRLKYIILDGEPILSSNIDDVINIILENNLIYTINLLSCPEEEFLKKIKSTVAKIQFKMSDIENTEYNCNIIKALELCNKYNIYTAVIFSLDKSNISKISDIINFCKKNNVKQFSFSRLEICPNIKFNENDYLNKDEYLTLSKKLLKIREKETNIHITSNDAIWKGCGACAISATIFPNGDIYPCAFLKIKAGNIKDGIQKAWNGEIFNDIRNSNLKGKCQECKYKLLCKGCRAIVYRKVKDFLDEDGGCWI